MPMIDRTGAEVLIPEENTRQIIQMVPERSTMMRLMRRLPDMGSSTRMIPVLSALPMSYFVDGDIGFKQTTAQAWENVKLYAEEIACILMWIRRRRTSPFRELDSKLENMMEQLRVIEKEARENTEAIATLQLNELSSAFVHYVDHNRPCPMSVKNGLSEMYKQYKSTGRNHVANDYMERLIGLPVDENERRGQT